MHVTKDCFEKVLQFSDYINTNFKHFPIRSLEGIRTCFGYQTVAYTILNRNSSGNVYISDIMGLSFTEERLNSYKEYYFKSDPFIKTIRNDLIKLDSDEQKHVWHFSDLRRADETTSSKYFSHLRETGLRYQAVLSGRKYRAFPTHVISIFKSEQEGDFTEEELTLLNMAGNVFVSTLKHYLRELDYELRLSAWKRCVDMQKSGLCIFTNLMPPDETPLFTTYKNLLFPGQTTREIIWSLTNNIDPMTVLQDNTPISFHRTYGEQTYQIRLIKEESQSISDDKNISTYIIMEVFPEEHTTVPSRQSSATQYNRNFDKYSFTDRELDVLALLQKGQSNRQIADTLFMSLSTVKTHTGNIYKKLGVSNRGAAISKLAEDFYKGK